MFFVIETALGCVCIRCMGLSDCGNQSKSGIAILRNLLQTLINTVCELPRYLFNKFPEGVVGPCDEMEAMCEQCTANAVPWRYVAVPSPTISLAVPHCGKPRCHAQLPKKKAAMEKGMTGSLPPYYRPSFLLP